MITEIRTPTTSAETQPILASALADAVSSVCGLQAETWKVDDGYCFDPNSVAEVTKKAPISISASQFMAAEVAKFENALQGFMRSIPPSRRWPWYSDALRLDAEKPVQALGHIFRGVDALLSGGNFAEVDAWLSSISPNDISVNLIGGILSITRQASERLPAREKFFNDAWKVVELRGRDVVKLLGSLKGRRPTHGTTFQVVVLE